MYTIKATRAARKLAKKVAADVGMAQDEIILESRSGPDRQVQASDVEKWAAQHKKWKSRNDTPSRRVRVKLSEQALPTEVEGQRLCIPQYGGQVLAHTEQNNTHDAVYAWGAFMQSTPEYIAGQANDAAHESAPELALYKKRGRWVTLDTITSPQIRRYFRTEWPLLAEQAWGGRA